MAAEYDRDGNRVFQLNYNLHTDEDWKDNSGNGNGNNKDNTGSGNNGNGNSSSGNNSNSGNGNGNSGNNGNGNNKENSKSEGTDDAGYGNATNAEEHNSQNQSGILFPVAEEISRTETDLIAMIKTTGKEKDYELIEYILNVNTQYTQVLMELNENGAMDAAYTYGTSRLTEDRFTGESNFYLYDPAGNVAGITDQDGYLWQSYRYDAFGNATFGSPQYDNEYTFNAESYNPNIQSQYLRARYYDMVKGNFLTEDSYLGDIREPLTLNRYSYCIGNPLFYDDPSGHWVTETEQRKLRQHIPSIVRDPASTYYGMNTTDAYKLASEYLGALHVLDDANASANYALHIKAAENSRYDLNYYIETAVRNSNIQDRCGLATVREGGFVGYLKYGATGITNDKSKGFYMLYDEPTLKSEKEEHYFAGIYARNGVKPGGALQSYGGSRGPNYMAGNKYDNQTYKPEIGTLKYPKSDDSGHERYGIAIGPVLQNPDFDANNNKMYNNSSKQILAEAMAYGTCVDVTIVLNGDRYYIPAIIIDTKAHSYPSGEIQTGDLIDPSRKDEYTGKTGAIVEWYTIQGTGEKNKSDGLKEFDRMGSIIIYRDERME